MRYIKDGKISECKVIRLGDKWISNPSAEQIAQAGWVEYVPPAPEPYTPSYEERVANAIRERYSIDDELAILRQRDTKQDEFAEYNAFCEECKRQAKEASE